MRFGIHAGPQDCTIDDLRRLCERGHPLAGVHRDPADVVPADLDLSGVQADTYVEMEVERGVADGARAADRARRSIERRDKPVADGLHFPASEAAEPVAHEGVVAVEQLPPGAVAEPGGVTG